MALVYGYICKPDHIRCAPLVEHTHRLSGVGQKSGKRIRWCAHTNITTHIHTHTHIFTCSRDETINLSVKSDAECLSTHTHTHTSILTLTEINIKPNIMVSAHSGSIKHHTIDENQQPLTKHTIRIIIMVKHLKSTSHFTHQALLFPSPSTCSTSANNIFYICT